MTHAVDAQPRINVMKPWLGEEETQALAEVISSGWVAQGPKVAEFERAFASHQGVEYGVATSSCTTALHLACVVAGLGPGDEVIVPSFSFIATANAPTYVGATPVFADVDPATGTLTADTVREVLSPATRAIIAVDQAGMPVDIGPLRELCDEHGLVLIEDAACGAGAEYGGAPVGVRADVTAWSFHPRKVLTTGEGGMLTTNRQDWAELASRLREHAMDASAASRHELLLPPAEHYPEIGFNFRMTDMQGAVGLVQLAKLDTMVARRRQLAEQYRCSLDRLCGIRCVDDPDYGTSSFQSFWIEVGPGYGASRDELMERLAEAGISARRGIMAAHRQPAYSGSDSIRVPLPTTEYLTDTTLILPLYHEMTEAELDRVITVITQGA